MRSIKELISTIEDPSNIRDALAASAPHTLRIAFDLDKNVQEIIRHKDDVEDLVLKRVQGRGKKEIDDISMACFCYILEKIGSRKTVPKLGNLLSEIHETRKRGEMAFTQYFAIHTIKVLAKQPGLRADLVYPDDEIEKTIRRIESPSRKKEPHKGER